MTGKEIRLGRIIEPETRTAIIVPMDHGVSQGPVAGLEDMRQAFGEAASGGADAVVAHKGLIRQGLQHFSRGLGLIMHLSGSTCLSPDPLAKTLVATVAEAVRLGADAVSVHVNLGNAHEREMLGQLGRVVAEAEEWGLPVLAMVYARGPRITNEYDPALVAHAARIGSELGADIVKVPYTGSPASFARVVAGCAAPVVIAGGPKTGSDRAVLEMAHGARQAGAAGLSIGRNVFQHASPSAMLAAMGLIVRGGASVNEALAMLAQTAAQAA